MAILILNWNGWKDTIECLDSVFSSDYKNYQVIVCDNDSQDESIEKIIDWATGRLIATPASSAPAILHGASSPVAKPIAYRLYDRKHAEGGAGEDDREYSLILIRTGANLGFAGGNNVGLRYVLAREGFEYVWLLNNDTVIKNDALRQLVKKAEYYKENGQKVGIVGSKLFYYDQPHIVQSVGGIYNKWLGTTKHLGLWEFDSGQYDNDTFIKNIDYVDGSAMLVSKSFLQEAGLMSEDYFLYYEELDWSLRGRRYNYALGYSWQSHVYHKEGGTIGSSSNPYKKSELSDYYGLRNRIIFARKFFPAYMCNVYLGFLAVIINRIRRGQINRLRLIWKVLRET